MRKNGRYSPIFGVRHVFRSSDIIAVEVPLFESPRTRRPERRNDSDAVGGGQLFP